ncbi:MAG: hypothetical protein Q9193_001419 [Seirophora villosa]
MSFSTDKQSRPPRWLAFRSSTSFIGAVIFIATFTDGVAYGAIVPILPFSLPERSGVPQDEVQVWISALLMAHGLAMAIASPVAGWFADEGSSRRFSFFSGIALLLASTLIFALGRSLVLLVAARCLQGAAAGIVYTVGLALLVDTVGQNDVGAWMGSALSGMSAGVMIGPFIAGIIYAKAGYLAVFATILAVIGVDLILRLFMIEKQSARKWVVESDYGTFSKEPHPQYRPISRDTVCSQEEDIVDTSTTGLRAVAPDDEFRPSDFGEPATDQPSGRRSALRDGLVRFLKTTAILLKSRGILAAMYGGFVQVTLICAFDSILPLFVHKTFGWETSGGGSIFLALTVPSLAAPIVGLMSDRLGARVVVLAGFATSTLTLALLSLVGQDSIQDRILLCTLLAITGAGNTMMLSPLAVDMHDIVSRLGEEHYLLFGSGGAFAKAYGLLNVALALGTMVGPAFAGLIYDREGWNVTMWALAAFCASGVVPVILFTGKKKVY